MSSRIALLLVFVLVLVGCSGPSGRYEIDATTSSQEASFAPTNDLDLNTTPVSESPSFATDPECIEWGRHPLLAQLPEPPEDSVWVHDAFSQEDVNQTHVVSYSFTPDSVKDYIQSLRDAGFSQEEGFHTFSAVTPSRIPIEGYYFDAHNADYTYVSLTFHFHEEKAGDISWVCTVMVCTIPKPAAAGSIQPNTAVWEDDPVLNLVCDPGTEYWEIKNEDVPSGAYRVDFPCMSMMEIRQYAQELQAYGFSRNLYTNTGVRMFSMFAQDAKGNGVVLSMAPGFGYVPRLQIFPAGTQMPDWWASVSDRQIYLPEPEIWSCTVLYNRKTVFLYDTDAQGALNYLESVEKLAKANGFIYSQTILEDEDRIQYEFTVMQKTGSGDNEGKTFTLTYNPNDPECPCKLTN